MKLVASGRVLHAGTMNGNPGPRSRKATIDALAKDYVRSIRPMAGANVFRDGLTTLLDERGLQAVPCGGGPVFRPVQGNRPDDDPRLSLPTRKATATPPSAIHEGALVLPTAAGTSRRPIVMPTSTPTLDAAARAGDSLKAGS